MSMSSRDARDPQARPFRAGKLTGDALWRKLDEPGAYLTPGEVAELFRVDATTVSRWCREGSLEHGRTPGGHYRILASSARRLLRDFR